MALLRTSVLAALLAAGCNASFSVSTPTVQGTATVSGDSTSLKARIATSFDIPSALSLAVNGFFFVSGEVDASSTNSSATATDNVVLGFGLAPGAIAETLNLDFPPITSVLSLSSQKTATESTLKSILASLATSKSLTGLFSGLVTGSAYASSISQAYLSLIEFTDTNGNNAIDDGESISQTVEISGLGFTGTSSESGGVYIETVTSSDKVLALQFHYSTNSTVQLSSGKIVTPRSISTDVYINNFSYKGSDTKLALRTLVAGVTATLSGSANFNLAATTSSSLATSTANNISSVFASWVGTAKTQAKGTTASGTVDASGSLTTVVTTVKDGSTTTGFESFLNFDTIVSGGAKVDVHIVDYVFNAVQPAAVYFDPTVGAGTVLNSSGVVSAASSVAALATSVIAAFALWF